MEQASALQEYERAASLLQTIRQIEHVVQSRALVDKVDGKNSDALALFRQGKEVMLVQLLFREGKLVGSEHYPFSNILEEDEELLSSFILQHYRQSEGLPEEILVPISLKDAPLIAEILTEALRKKNPAAPRITILNPQKGEKRALLGIAEQNAKAIFDKEKDHQDLKEKMLLDLQETLKLNRYPKRIECFDTSNMSGTDPVASLVVFTDGEKDSKRGRLFKIRTGQTGDYPAMREVLHRHLSRAKKADDLPDLIIVDGGKGHLNTALDLFKELDIASVDVIALAKEEGRHDKGMTAEKIFLPDHKEPIHLNARSSLLFLLQKIRDEAHRRAITFHRKRRQKRTLSSALDEIPGIGPIKRRRLLQHFGSVEKIFSATEEELKQVKGISKKEIVSLRTFSGKELP
jgi:excinuclease ABC subunit C